MTRAERAILDMELQATYTRFEYWRRKHVEQFEEEDKIQADINRMPERQRRWARQAPEEKRSAPGYVYDVYCEDVDEQACFDFVDEMLAEEAQMLTKSGDETWRKGWNSVRNRQTPTERLEAFERQVIAAETRGPLWYHTAMDIERRVLNRAETRAMLEGEIRRETEMLERAIKEKEEQEKREEEEKYLASIVEAMQMHHRLIDVPGVRNLALLADTQLDLTAGYLR